MSMNIIDPNECANKESALYVCNGPKEKIYQYVHYVHV